MSTPYPISSDPTDGGPIALAPGAPTVTNVGADTPVPFAQPARHLYLHNKTTANLYYELDAAATLGSPIVPPNNVLILDVPFTVLHLFTAAAQNILGTADGNIVPKAWA